MTKKQRKQVFDKFGGKCAYTGKELLDDWQVDHIIPKLYFRIGLYKTDPNDIANLAPTFKIINHYKRACADLEHFRAYMHGFSQRIKRLPKNPIVEKSIKRKQYMLTIASLFDITIEKPFSGIFYFETIKTTNNGNRTS